MKPARHDVPTDGVVPLSTTLDHVGPIARSVGDASILWAVLRGDQAAPLPATPDLRNVRFGVLRDYFAALLDLEVAHAFERACARLADAGAILEDAVIPHAGDIGPIYLGIVLAEAAAYHAKTLESHADDYTPNVRIRLEMGRYILAEDYARALRGRELLRHEVEQALEGRAALLLPTLPIPAPKLGATTVRVGGTDEPVRNIMLRLTQLFNVTGHPAITLPCGATTQGLPIGLQIAGHRGLHVCTARARPERRTPRGCRFDRISRLSIPAFRVPRPHDYVPVSRLGAPPRVGIKGPRRPAV